MASNVLRDRQLCGDEIKAAEIADGAAADSHQVDWPAGNLSTPKSVQKRQMALHAKAKAEAAYRFYALYDKINSHHATPRVRKIEATLLDNALKSLRQPSLGS